MDDVLLNKSTSLERCLNRIKIESSKNTLLTNITVQDSIVLNLERSCQLCLDIGLYVIKKHKLGLPQTNRDVFSILNEANIIPLDLAETLKKMVGFRNIAVHDYQKLDLAIINSIISNHLTDFKLFSETILKSTL